MKDQVSVSPCLPVSSIRNFPYIHQESKSLALSQQERAQTSSHRANVRSKAVLKAKDFDKLPDSAHVRRSVVEVLFDCSKSTVLRKMKQGLLPQPETLGSGVSIFNVGKLRQAKSAMASKR